MAIHNFCSDTPSSLWLAASGFSMGEHQSRDHSSDQQSLSNPTITQRDHQLSLALSLSPSFALSLSLYLYLALSLLSLSVSLCSAASVYPNHHTAGSSFHSQRELPRAGGRERLIWKCCTSCLSILIGSLQTIISVSHKFSRMHVLPMKASAVFSGWLAL